MNRTNRSPNAALLLAATFAFLGCGDSGDGSPGGGDGGDGGGGGPGDNAAPVANAGESVDVSSGFNVTLDGSGSSDADGDALSYTWTQTKGPDVTNGAGTLTGVDPSFVAPDEVDTIMFELVVNDGVEDSAPASVAVNVFEDLNVTYFVDGDNGNDETGNGSRDNPFASIGKAVSELTSNLEDIYVRTRAGADPYDETGTDLDIPGGTSLYGGYGSGWMRNVEANKTPIQTNHRGIQLFEVTQNAWVSGFDIRTSDSPEARESVFGVSATGSGAFGVVVEDNIITTGDVEAGQARSPGSNYGVAVRFLASAKIANNVITVGSGGDGLDGADGDDGNPGDDGENGNRTSGNRALGGDAGPGGDGGLGGTRGGGINGNGGGGGNGSPGTAPLGGTIAGGSGGPGGSGNVADGGSLGNPGNTGGRGIPGEAGNGQGTLTGSFFAPSNGKDGGRGGNGSGGGGGGGGEANDVGVVGGGGGGGGEGGQGGGGGVPGTGGGASIGVWLSGIESAELGSNTITTGLGGAGGRDGVGGDGGPGGLPGSGAAGDDLGILGRGGGGASGRVGGQGGRGGYGGAGGGGPSYGVVFSAGMAPMLSGNTITSGPGGAGGPSFLRGNAGDGGFSFAVYDADPTDAFFATLSQNQLAAGAPGPGGEGGGDVESGTEPGMDGQTGSRNWQ